MHSPLEQYLEEVQSHLRVLPDTQREEEVAEIRQHVETMVEAHRELGLTEEAAMTSALAQFGTAQTLSKGLTRAFRRGDKSLHGNLQTATAVAFIACCTLSTLQSHLFHALIPAHINSTQLRNLQPWFFGSLVMVPLLQGWLTAMTAPRKALGGIVLSMITLVGIQFIAGNFLRSLPTAVSLEMRLHLLAFDILRCAISVALALLGAQAGIQWKKARLCRLRMA